MFSFVGETVLDPFLGSGTTSVAALKLGRNSVGYEINEDYLPTIKQRLSADIGIFDEDAGVEVIKQPVADTDYEKELQKLPYVFKDPVPFERKVDPKSLRFGSRIDGTETIIPQYHTVEEPIPI
jgi:site-specific DNA-methyltransferase (adenine-specific)